MIQSHEEAEEEVAGGLTEFMKGHDSNWNEVATNGLLIDIAASLRRIASSLRELDYPWKGEVK